MLKIAIFYVKYPWGPPWGPLEAEGRPFGCFFLVFFGDFWAYNGPFEAISGHREHRE